MTQEMHNLSLLQNKRHNMPSSPNAAKRLYRNLSEKLKGSHTSFDEAYFRARSDRLSLRKASMDRAFLKSEDPCMTREDCYPSPMEEDHDLMEAGDHDSFVSALPETIDSCFTREA